jgi:putative spermidine/putrescine transport system substrate-binding protein
VKTELPDDLKALIPVRGDEMKKIVLWDWKAANASRDKVIERWNKEMR